ncbi:TPA: phosphotransferase family protein [Serratia marcescens]
MNQHIAQCTMTVLGYAGTMASATRISGGRASEVYLVTSSAHDAVVYRLPKGALREAKRRLTVMARIAECFPLAPKPLAVSNTADGSPLLITQRLNGVIPASCGELSLTTVDRLARHFVSTLATLHAIEVAPANASLDYFPRIMAEWQRRWNTEDAAQDDAEFQAIALWLSQRSVPSRPDAFLHNDYKLDNILVDPGDPGRMVGVVDWELSSIGHPLSDLGIMLAYWIEPQDSSLLRLDVPGPSCVAGAPSRAALVDFYAEATNRDVEHPEYWCVFGLWRLAVITQQLSLRHDQPLPRSRLIIRTLLARAAEICGGKRL